MEKAFRLKPESWFLQIGIPVIILTLIAAALYIIFGEITMQTILTCVFLLAAGLHILFLVRMKNRAHLVPLVFYLSGAATFLSIPLQQPYLTATLATAAAIFFVFFIWTLKSRKIKWRYREMLELAARSVRTAEGGFSTRPFPAGRIQAQPKELADFGKFLKKFALAYPLDRENKLILIIPRDWMPFLFGFNTKHLNATYVTIGRDGALTVNIAEKDYHLYQQNFTFDQLNAALGNLFMDLFQLYQQGKTLKIIERMDELRFVG